MKRALFLLTVGLFLCSSLPAAEPQVVFEDTFDGKLGEGWTWLRENPDAWRIRDDALEIRVQPGLGHNVKNALVRKVPDRGQGAYAFEVTVTSMHPPTQQYEQCGLTWYNGGRPVMKLVKERIDGDLWIIPGRKSMRSKSVRLRLTVRGDRWTAQFRPQGADEFVTAGEGALPAANEDQVSLQCYNGPPDAEHWFRLDDFRILRLTE